MEPVNGRRAPHRAHRILGPVAWLLATLTTLLAAPASPRLTATIDPPLIAPGTQTTLQLRFENGAPASVPEIPAVPGLRIRYTGQGRETTIVNGSVQSAVVLSYAVDTTSNTQPGTYTIPAVRADVGGQTLSSQPVQLQVSAEGEVGDIAFLTLSFPKSEFYVGESTLAEILLFSRYGGRIAQHPGLSASGAVVGAKIEINNLQAIQVVTNSTVFSRVGWQIPVTFAKTGTLRFSAEDCVLTIQYRSQQRARDPFGFPSLFGGVETRNFNLASPPLAVTVRPVPTENVPAGFSGAVGRFNLEAQTSSTNVAAGDPLTLTVKLSGQGNLEALRWEAPSDWTGLKAYEPTSRLEADAFGLQGQKTIEQVLVPESTAVNAIPPIQFAFFDPEPGVYRVLRHPGFPLTVTPALSPSVQVMVTRPADSDAPPAAADIVHIKSRLGPLALVESTALRGPVTFLWSGIPVLAWILSLLWRSRAQRLASNPRHQRQRRTARRLKQGLIDLRQHAQANAVEAFHSELFRLLQEVLGERLDLPASSITGAVVNQHLQTPATPPELARAVDRLFTQCDQARYAPQAMSCTLSDLFTQAESTLRQLQILEVNRED